MNIYYFKNRNMNDIWDCEKCKTLFLLVKSIHLQLQNVTKEPQDKMVISCINEKWLLINLEIFLFFSSSFFGGVETYREETYVFPIH